MTPVRKSRIRTIVPVTEGVSFTYQTGGNNVSNKRLTYTCYNVNCGIPVELKFYPYWGVPDGLGFYSHEYGIRSLPVAWSSVTFKTFVVE